jgi:DinB family
MPQSQVLADILLHLFNHQTHHRGQAHACLSILTGGEPPSLDLLAFQRGGSAPTLERLIASKPAIAIKTKSATTAVVRSRTRNGNSL